MRSFFCLLRLRMDSISSDAAKGCSPVEWERSTSIQISMPLSGLLITGRLSARTRRRRHATLSGEVSLKTGNFHAMKARAGRMKNHSGERNRIMKAFSFLERGEATTTAWRFRRARATGERRDRGKRFFPPVFCDLAVAVQRLSMRKNPRLGHPP